MLYYNQETIAEQNQGHYNNCDPKKSMGAY